MIFSVHGEAALEKEEDPFKDPAGRLLPERAGEAARVGSGATAMSRMEAYLLPEAPLPRGAPVITALGWQAKKSLVPPRQRKE
jgi:hypothetical protein